MKAFPTRALPALLLLLLAAAVARAATPGAHYFGSAKPPADNILRFNNAAEPEIVDPGLSVGQADGIICRIIWEGLTVSHPSTLEPLPGMAERWEMTPDGLVYTFHLRRAQWSDGHPVTAGDFLYAWRRVLNPVTAARYAGQLYYLRNAEAYNKKRITDPAQVGVAAPDDSTLIVTLEHPTPYFLDLLSFYTFMPVPRWCIEKFGDRWSRPGNVVGNGPFLLTDWKPANYFKFRKNPGYWDAAHVKLDGVVAYSIDDLNTSLNMYKAGMTDWNPSGNLPAQFIPYVRDKADYRSAPYLGSYFYSFNVTDPTLKNVWLRRALAWSIDRESITRDLFKGSRLPLGTITPLGTPGYTAPKPIGLDLAYARECLAKAGYPGGKGCPKLSILFNTSEDHRKIAEVLQAQWKVNLGLDVELSNQEWGSYLKATTTLQYQVARRSWIGDYADANTFLGIMVTGDGNNRTGWSNAAYDSLIALAARTLDHPVRAGYLKEAETILLDECPLLPIYNYTLTELIKPYVRGIEPNALDQHFLKFAWFDRGEASPPGSGTR